MPPTDRQVIRFAAEPPQDMLPHGRWADRLKGEFLGACLRIDDEGEDLGEAGEMVWYPDRTYAGRVYVPVTTRTSTDYELYGYVSYVPNDETGEAADLQASASFTSETADHNLDWSLDLCEEVIGRWRGERGQVAEMTLVWGQPTERVRGATVATAELADLAVDQCEGAEHGRFTLVAPDAYRGDTLDIKLFDEKGAQIAGESLYEDDEDDG